MATTAIPHFEPFSVELAPFTLAARWTRWTTRFENLMTAMNVTAPARKKAMLLHLAGEGVYGIYDGLIVPDVPVDADPTENNVYIAARKALDDHFSPKKNADFEIYNFRLAKQLQHETVDTYHARLRSLAKYCQFTDTDKEIKSHIIQTCVSTRLRRRALSEPTLTLNDRSKRWRTVKVKRVTPSLPSATGVRININDVVTLPPRLPTTSPDNCVATAETNFHTQAVDSRVLHGASSAVCAPNQTTSLDSVVAPVNINNNTASRRSRRLSRRRSVKSDTYRTRTTTTTPYWSTPRKPRPTTSMHTHMHWRSGCTVSSMAQPLIW